MRVKRKEHKRKKKQKRKENHIQNGKQQNIYIYTIYTKIIINYYA